MSDIQPVNQIRKSSFTCSRDRMGFKKGVIRPWPRPWWRPIKGFGVGRDQISSFSIWLSGRP